jgi:tetratricopeptide (TPR) repeat protein
MSPIEKEAREHEPFPSTMPLAEETKKPAQFSIRFESKVSAGEERIRLEGKMLGWEPEKIEQTVKKYREQVQDFVRVMKEKGIDPEDGETFLREAHLYFYSSVPNQILDTQETLADATDSGQYDCDTSALVIFEAGKALGINGMELVEFEGHVIVKAGTYALETGNREVPIVRDAEEFDRQYGKVYGRYSTQEDLIFLNYLTVAKVAIKYGRVTEGLGMLDNASRHMQNEPNPKLYHFYGEAYNKLGEFDKAISNYEKALDLEPGMSLTRDRLRILLDLYPKS